MQRTDPTISEAVLVAVAEREGVGVSELGPPLFDAVNPDALDRLFRRSPGTVRFEYAGYTVTVDHDHTVDLTPISEEH
jgi:hypothetical protein